jgi:hypothetical protein
VALRILLATQGRAEVDRVSCAPGRQQDFPPFFTGVELADGLCPLARWYCGVIGIGKPRENRMPTRNGNDPQSDQHAARVYKQAEQRGLKPI